jgi:membrane fusion protein, multidrug efflux system
VAESTHGCKQLAEIPLDSNVRASNIMLIVITCSSTMKHKQQSPGNTGKPRLTSLGGIALAALIVAGLTGILRARVAMDPELEARPPLTVSTTAYQLQQSYTRQISYLGLVTAGRKAILGFEFPGQIAALHAREGSPVKQGQELASLDTSALQARRRATAADLEQAETELELAQLKARRQQELSATGAVSKEAFDDTRLRARALASRVEAVAARLATIDIELEKSHLLAPYDGVIADRYVYEGAVVSPGTPVVRLVELAAQEAHIGVAAAQATTLEPGKHYQLKLRDTVFDAPLLRIRPDVDPTTRTTVAVFAIPSRVNALDGEPITLVRQESVAMQGGWLPIASLLEGQRGLWTVLRLEAQDGGFRTVREAVEILDIQADRVYAHGTLPDGARIVASGLHRITPGAVVLIQESR